MQIDRRYSRSSIGSTPFMLDEDAAAILEEIKTATSSAPWDYPDGCVPFTVKLQDPGLQGEMIIF